MRLLVLALAVVATGAVDPARAETWRGTLDCGAGDDRFLTERTVGIADQRVSYRSDDPEPARETWTGIVDPDGAAYVVGSYFWERRKSLFLVGQKTETALRLTGWRGPKKCSFTAEPEEY